jgi:VanZ family protein
MDESGKRVPGGEGRLVDALLWGLSAFLIVSSVVLSIDPEPDVYYGLDLTDGALHLLGYGGLTGTLLLAAVWRPGRGRGRFPRAAPLVVAGTVLLGAAIEVAQAFVPGRTSDWRDFVANVLGITLALTGWATMRLTSRLPGGPSAR